MFDGLLIKFGLKKEQPTRESPLKGADASHDLKAYLASLAAQMVQVPGDTGMKYDPHHDTAAAVDERNKKVLSQSSRPLKRDMQEYIHPES